MLGVFLNLKGSKHSIYEVSNFLKSHNYYYLGENSNKIIVAKSNWYFFRIRRGEEIKEVYNLLSNFVSEKRVTYRVGYRDEDYEKEYQYRLLAKLLY